MSDWQPIETAPRDGSWILLSGGKTTEIFWGSGGEAHIGRPVVARFESSLNEWVYGHWDSDWRSDYEHPTLWMPIPALPEGANYPAGYPKPTGGGEG